MVWLILLIRFIDLYIIFQKNHKKLQSENAKLLEAAKLTAVSDKTEREQQNQLLEQQKASIQV